MKAFNIIFCILFVVAAGLQYNDGDPYIWIPLYGYAAWLCYRAAQKRYLPGAYLFGFAVYLAFFIYYAVFKHGFIDWFQQYTTPDLVQSMKADQPWIEETREVMGLSILILVLCINWIVAAKSSRRV